VSPVACCDSGGCLTVNGAIACGDEAEPVRQVLNADRTTGVALLRRHFEQAKSRHDLPKDSDPAALASFFAAVVYGMAVLASCGASRRDLDQVIRAAMKAWPTTVEARSSPRAAASKSLSGFRTGTALSTLFAGNGLKTVVKCPKIEMRSWSHSGLVKQAAAYWLNFARDFECIGGQRWGFTLLSSLAKAQPMAMRSPDTPRSKARARFTRIPAPGRFSCAKSSGYPGK
jgi:hypothetical protein